MSRKKDDVSALSARVRPFRPGMRVSWKIVSKTIVGFFKLYCRFEVVHPERVPRDGAFLAAATHCSHLDPPIVGSALGREAYYLARSGILRVPLVGQWCRHFNTVAIRRGESDRGAIKKCREVLQAGWPLIFYPEGTRSEDGKLGAIQGGYAMILDGLNVPYVPIMIQDTYKVLPKGAIFPRPRKVRMVIGEPAYLPERREKESLRDWLGRCSAQMEARYRELGAE